MDLGLAHESALKEAETDAMKRALMTFGNPFGLALYDKQQRQVTSSVREEQAPQGQAGQTKPLPEAKAIRESSLRSLREPLWVRAAQWRIAVSVTGGFFERA